MLPKEWLKYSVFANLSYVRWNPENSTTPQNITAAGVEFERLPDTVSRGLFFGSEAWSIPSFHPNDPSGFAANVFRNGDEAVLAIRGTEANLIEVLPFVGDTGLQDLLDADMHDIRVYGFAMDQAVGLVNYVMRLEAGPDVAAVAQVQLETLSVAAGTPVTIDQPFVTFTELTLDGPVDNYFWLAPADPAAGLPGFDGATEITVTGHSLGGHLAALAIRLFPTLFDSAVTFNAPGFDPALSEELTDQFILLFGNFLASPPADTFGDVAARITAIESEDSGPGDDVSLVASLLTGIPVGQEVFIHTENNSHSMDQLMDALAVHSLVATLNPTLDFEQLLRFYDGSSDDPGATEESIVSALSRVILGTDPVFEPVEAGLISHGDFDDRAEIHDQIVAIQAAVVTGGLTLESLWDKSAEQLAELAQGSIAYRSAIQNLDPFVILGDTSIYSQLSSVAISANLHSEDYWLARAEMLLAHFDLGVTDGEFGSPDYLVSFADLSDGVEFSVAGSDFTASPNTIFVRDQGTGGQIVGGSDGDDRLFGGIGADQLAGGAGSDFIDGGAGADVLYSTHSTAAEDSEADHLAGGAGADFYFAGHGDVISDSGRDVSGIVVSGVSIAGSYVWLEDGSYELLGGGASLVITGSDALITVQTLPALPTVTILDFVGSGLAAQDGDFGITLITPDGESPPTATITLIGTEHDDAPGLGYGGVNLVGTEGDDGILGLEGDDYIRTFWGADFADAGPGNDFVMHATNWSEDPDLVGDVFVGGTGNDALIGYGGDDRLSGGDGDDALQGEGASDVLSGGNGGDVIFGGAGGDRMYGDGGDDRLFGDRGGDILSAIKWIQRNQAPNGSWWNAAEPAEPAYGDPSNGADRIWGGKGGDELFGELGPDTLFGESGADTLSGGYGDDLLYGGSHGDRLTGDEGGDVLFGDDGSDTLFGGYGDDRLDGGYGDDRQNGNEGVDILVGGVGSDDYVFDTPMELGWEVIREEAGQPEALNRVQIQNGDASVLFRLEQSGDDLAIVNLYGGGGILVENWFADPESVLDEIEFYDRTWNISDMQAVLAGQGTRWNDSLYGGDGDDLMLAGDGADYGYGGAGDDVIFGEGGGDQLLGEAGNDRIYGGDGWEFLDGGGGDDVLHPGDNLLPDESIVLAGGEGSDTYIVDAGPGALVIIVETDANDDDQDVIRILGDFAPGDLAIHQRYFQGAATSDLLISFLPEAGDAAAEIRISNWFAGETREIERIELEDGAVLTETDIEARFDTASDGRDYLVGAGGDVILSGLGGDDELIGQGARNELRGDAGADLLQGSGGENLLAGGSGRDHLVISAAGSPMSGQPESVDILLGGNGQDVLDSRAWNGDAQVTGITLVDGGSDGDTLGVNGSRLALIAGGSGFDSIAGNLSAGDSVILLNRGDQGDVVANTAEWSETGAQVISFGGGITRADIALKQDGDDLLILTGELEGVRLDQYFDAQGQPAHWLDYLQVVTQASPAYDPDSTRPDESSPVLLIEFASVMDQFLAQAVPPGEVWQLADAQGVLALQYLPGQAFGGQVVYEYALRGGDVYDLMGDEVWTSLRAVTDGTAPAGIQVLQTHPVAGAALDDLAAHEDELFQFVLPEDLIISGLTQEALPIELVSPLPPWLAFDPLTRQLSGTPAQQDVGAITLTFSATNQFGQDGTVTINLDIANTNDAPVVSNPPGPIEVVAGAAFEFMLPEDTFSDEDLDVLTVSLTGIDGGPLPDWLSFDLDTRVLTGAAPPTATDDVLLTLSATDPAGESASTTLTLAITPQDDTGGEVITGTSGSDALEGTDGNDTISAGFGNDYAGGGNGDDQIDGGPGNDRVTGGNGEDRIEGGAGTDALSGDHGSDVIYGGPGTDRIFGGTGDDYLDGGQGPDRLYGDDGNDVLVTQQGKDVLAGGIGHDTYEIQAGADRVTIEDPDGNDVIRFDASFAGDSARFSQRHDDLIINLRGTDTRVTVADWFSDPGARVERIEFGDGTTLLEQDVLQLVHQRSRFFAEVVEPLGISGASPEVEALPLFAAMDLVLDSSWTAINHY